jgi:hypothetical protein
MFGTLVAPETLIYSSRSVCLFFLSSLFFTCGRPSNCPYGAKTSRPTESETVQQAHISSDPTLPLRLSRKSYLYSTPKDSTRKTMLTTPPYSPSHEDGTMLAKPIPPSIHILNTRCRSKPLTLTITDEFRTRLRSRLLRVVSRRQFRCFGLWGNAYARVFVRTQ